jgi:hypothetical protein
VHKHHVDADHYLEQLGRAMLSLPGLAFAYACGFGSPIYSPVAGLA